MVNQTNSGEKACLTQWGVSIKSEADQASVRLTDSFSNPVSNVEAGVPFFPAKIDSARNLRSFGISVKGHSTSPSKEWPFSNCSSAAQKSQEPRWSKTISERWGLRNFLLYDSRVSADGQVSSLQNTVTFAILMNSPQIDPHTCMYSMLFRVNDEAPHTKGSEFLGASLDTKLQQTRTGAPVA
jgi:hypothetical protein